MIELHAASFAFGILVGIGLAFMLIGTVAFMLAYKQYKLSTKQSSK